DSAITQEVDVRTATTPRHLRTCVTQAFTADVASANQPARAREALTFAPPRPVALAPAPVRPSRCPSPSGPPNLLVAGRPRGFPFQASPAHRRKYHSETITAHHCAPDTAGLG